MKKFPYFMIAITFSFLSASNAPCDAIGTAAPTDAPGAAPTTVQPATDVNSKMPAVARSKDLRFDEAVVEGMNSSSKTSLENSESRKNANAKHLYRKRSNYRPEIQHFPSSLEFAP